MGIFESFLNGAKSQMQSTARSLGRDMVNKAVSTAKKTASNAMSGSKDKQSTTEVKDVGQRLKESGMKERAEALGNEYQGIEQKLGAAAASGDMKQVTGALQDLMGFAGKAGHAQMDGVGHVADFLSEAEGGNSALSGFADATRAVGEKLESDGEKIRNGT